MQHPNLYRFGSPCLAGSALVSIGCARLAHRPPLAEARATLIADLGAAGASVESAFQIWALADAVPQLDIPPTMTNVLEPLETLVSQSRAILATQLVPEQLAAFDLGVRLSLAAEAAGAAYDSLAARQAAALRELRRAAWDAASAGADPAPINRFIATGEQGLIDGAQISALMRQLFESLCAARV